MAAHVPSAWARLEAVRKARAVLGGDLEILEGCRSLASLAHDVVPDWSVDADFVVVGAIASEIDDLPLGSVRSQWSSTALARADLEIKRYTEAAREDVLAACRNIIERFGAPDANALGDEGAV